MFTSLEEVVNTMAMKRRFLFLDRPGLEAGASILRTAQCLSTSRSAALPADSPLMCCSSLPDLLP